ncbi:MAG: pyridoxamine 5'-phosphate oxidase [Phycisphaeraceae bacterium]|nr:pyridoxamine 5'-phosphate oxidase [Phycisphaeraceae bacterium]
MMNPHDQTEPNPIRDALRERYALPQTLPDPLPDHPMDIVRTWFDNAHDLRVQPNPNAISLATCDAQGIVSCRIVLCKHLNPRGYLTFYTNYDSRKGLALRERPRAAAVMHWDALDRQIRFEGVTVRAPEFESDVYFASRPVESRLGAWASDQSQPIDSREAMLERVQATAARLGVTPDHVHSGASIDIPRPPHWGGYRLWADRIELWVGGPGRVHDRGVWTRTLAPSTEEAAFTPSEWLRARLQP